METLSLTEWGEETIIPEDRAVSPWPPRLPFDIAFGESEEYVCAIYDITPEKLATLCQNLLFRKEVAKHTKEIAEQGITFKAKAKMQAEEYLQDLDGIVKDTTTPASVKLAAIVNCVRWGGLEVQNNKADNTPAQTKIEIAWMAPQEDAPQKFAARITQTTNEQ